MGIFRSIESADGDIGWSYSQFSNFAERVREKCQDVLDSFDQDVLDNFLLFAEGQVDKHGLIRAFEEWIDLGEFHDDEIPWKLCEEVEPLLRKVVELPSFVNGHQNMAIALCDAMKHSIKTKTNLSK